MPELLSKRQLLTISSIPKAKLDLNCGPMGCGKTYSISLGLGVACSTVKPTSDGGCIALVGKTAAAVKSNICNVLSANFGSNFKYDTGKKDGFAKDATIFNHRLRIIGLNDSNAEGRIRGLNAYKIIADEVSTFGRDNFDKIQARLRGETPEGWVAGFVGSTNPDSPAHWLKKMIDESSDINYIKWTEHDNITSKAIEYYNTLRARYKNSPAYYSRYVLGEWAAAEGLVYGDCFNEKVHILSEEFIKDVKIVSYKIGVDFGTTNPTAILLIGVTEAHEYIVLDEQYVREASLSLVCNMIRDWAIEYYSKLTKIFIDPAAKVLIKQLKDEGMLNIQGANNSVIDGIDFIKDLFTQERLYISERCTNLIDELFTYAYSEKDHVNVVKENDHACDALRYALYS